MITLQGNRQMTSIENHQLPSLQRPLVIHHKALTVVISSLNKINNSSESNSKTNKICYTLVHLSKCDIFTIFDDTEISFKLTVLLVSYQFITSVVYIRFFGSKAVKFCVQKIEFYI